MEEEAQQEVRPDEDLDLKAKEKRLGKFLSRWYGFFLEDVSRDPWWRRAHCGHSDVLAQEATEEKGRRGKVPALSAQRA